MTDRLVTGCKISQPLQRHTVCASVKTCSATPLYDHSFMSLCVHEPGQQRLGWEADDESCPHDPHGSMHLRQLLYNSRPVCQAASELHQAAKTIPPWGEQLTFVRCTMCLVSKILPAGFCAWSAKMAEAASGCWSAWKVVFPTNSASCSQHAVCGLVHGGFSIASTQQGVS